MSRLKVCDSALTMSSLKKPLRSGKELFCPPWLGFTPPLFPPLVSPLTSAASSFTSFLVLPFPSVYHNYQMWESSASTGKRMRYRNSDMFRSWCNSGTPWLLQPAIANLAHFSFLMLYLCQTATYCVNSTIFELRCVHKKVLFQVPFFFFFFFFLHSA